MGAVRLGGSLTDYNAAIANTLPERTKILWIGNNTRMRRWELVATHQLSELKKNPTVVLEQNVPPSRKAGLLLASMKDHLSAVVTRTASR